jgi:Tetratricopeptide repeat
MPTRARSRRVRCVAALAVLCALLVPSAAWAQPADVIAENTIDGRARLIVDGDGPVAVTVDGQRQPTITEPLLSDRLAMALVVDTSTAGGPGLPPGLRGLVDFALAAPPATRATLVTDTTPPAVVAPLRPGPASVLPGLSGLTPLGDRQTATALDLAIAQLPHEPDSPRLVVLYTAANNAGGSPGALAARLRAEGVVLAVVTTAEDDAYWAAVAAGTCGVVVRARSTAVVDAFAQVTTELRTRFLVTLPAPARAAPAVVQVGPRSADVEIPTASDGGVDPAIVLAAAAVGAVALALGGVAIVRRRRRAQPVRSVPDPATPSVDRGSVLTAIENALAAGGPVVVRAADGRAGLGVTTAMVQFAHRYRDAYDVAWWIAAQDPQLIADQMAQLAEALGVAAPTDTAEQATAAALAALRERGRWLLVFDDAGSRRDLARFLPDGAGHVLVGTTDPDWGAREVPVPPFSRAESVGLLQIRREGLTAAEADHVAEALRDVPLDIDTAGATLAATGMSVTSYVDAVAAAAAVSVAFDRLAADEPPALALLTLFAWLSPEPVPRDLLAEHSGQLPPTLAGHDRSQLTATLGRRGLIRVDEQGVQLHRVPAAHLVRRTIEERPGGARWATWAVRLLHAAVPPDPTDPTSWPACRRLIPHVLAATDPGRPLDDVAVEVGGLLRAAAVFLQARGEQQSARALLEDVHDLYRRKLGRDHAQTRSAARALADNLRALGHPDHARRVLEDARADGPG